jgi:MoxR-like ATPase
VRARFAVYEVAKWDGQGAPAPEVDAFYLRVSGVAPRIEPVSKTIGVIMSNKKDVLREPAEIQFKTELDALKSAEKNSIPEGWAMSPQSVYQYITGGKVKGVDIMPKYIGHKRLVEIAISTLLTDRGLLLIGEPGTAKSWLSEHLSAAIHGDSTKVVQGTMGTTEEQIKYSWNYAMLIAKGPSEEALVKTPIYNAMEEGGIARFEEISRCASEVQDALISIMSEKCISIPELSKTVSANRGFSIIATANTRDKGVNDMSSALKRRFNIVILPAPATQEAEMEIVTSRVKQLSGGLKLTAALPSEMAVHKIVTIFRELRKGQTEDGKEKIKAPSGVMSTAEAISMLINSMALASSFGDGKVTDKDLSAGLLGAIVKDDDKDAAVFKEYLDNIIKKRGSEWRDLYQSCRELL